MILSPSIHCTITIRSDHFISMQPAQPMLLVLLRLELQRHDAWHGVCHGDDDGGDDGDACGDDDACDDDDDHVWRQVPLALLLPVPVQ
jgi:hypothetical protein